MLGRMKQQKLIETLDNRDDKRSTIVKLTEKAKTLEKVYNDISEEMKIQYYRNFDEKEIRLFESMLEKVLKNLERGK